MRRHSEHGQQVMPKVKTSLTPAEYAILGLIRERPTYGYEIKKQLVDLERVCPIEPAMVYAILRSLAGFELIDGTVDDTTQPPRSVYEITERGDAQFQRWLRRPVGRIREVRLDFLIKLYFALREDPALARQILAAQVEAVHDYAAELEQEREQQTPSTDAFARILMESRLSAARITLEWLEHSLDELSRQRARRKPGSSKRGAAKAAV
jgi:PadR family transcriptional regulator AphA